MPEGLIEAAAQFGEPTETRIYGVAVAVVIDNLDITGLGRVQLHFSWMPEIEPWARVATLSAGAGRGAYFIPQVSDEVLVAFNHGDVREPYVIGSLWNNLDRPPATAPTDAVNKRVIRTPLGHEIEFDDLTQSITITSSTEQKVTIEPEKIKLETNGGAATVTLETDGNISLQSTRSIELKAPTISLRGSTIELEGSSRASINGGLACDIQANLVRIN